MSDLIVFITPFLAIGACIALLLVLIYFTFRDMFGLRNSETHTARSKIQLTIIARVGDDAAQLKRFYVSLESCRRKSFDLVLVRPASSSMSLKDIRDITSPHTFRTVIYSPRSQKNASDILAAYTRSAKGERVLLTHTDTLLTDSTLLSLKQLRQAEASALRLQSITISSGMDGVIHGIGYALHRMTRRMTHMRHVPDYGHDTYLLSPSLLKRSGVVYGRDEWRPRYAFLRESSANVRLNTGFVPVIAALVLITVGSLLSVSAVEGYGLEAFTITWIASIAFGLILVASDSFITPRQKIETIVCAGFMPILLLAAILLKRT